MEFYAHTFEILLFFGTYVSQFDAMFLRFRYNIRHINCMTRQHSKDSVQK